MKPYPDKSYNPLKTNAAHNREQAIRLFNAGFSAAEIAEEYPLVWKRDNDGKIGQRYKWILSDGRKEIDVLITLESVTKLIKERKSK
jgi:hypothetical protein